MLGDKGTYGRLANSETGKTLRLPRSPAPEIMITIVLLLFSGCDFEGLVYHYHMEADMNDIRMWPKGSFTGTIGAVALILTILLATGSAFSHGGKKHTNSFTALKALQKATEMYDKLVDRGKLPESWETDLKKVDISNRPKGDQWEYVVSFERSAGEPNTVYIFFTAEGKYSGSNFTGK